jgi:hypothetical protein
MKKALLISILASTILVLAAPTTWALEEIDALSDRIVDPAPEAPILDTALVFTNVGGSTSHAKFAAYDEWGEAIGGGEIEIPSNGLVYVLASRIAQAAGLDGFVGHVKAKASGRVIARSVILGALGTEIDAVQHYKRRRVSEDSTDSTTDGSRIVSHILFPVVATK